MCPCHVAGSADAPVLLSAGKRTVQSSTEGSQSSDLAVDGSSSSQADTCATSLKQGAQYWQIDLAETFQIVNVTVINRCGLPELMQRRYSRDTKHMPQLQMQ